MTDADAADPVPSPCLRLCALGTDGLCRGCFRTLDEIAAWPAASEAARREIVLRAASRRPQTPDTAS